MADEADDTVMLYIEILSQEESILKSMEEGILEVLSKNSINVHPFWAGTTDFGERILQLILPAQPEATILITIPAYELDGLSLDELASRLNKNIREIYRAHDY